MSRNSSGTYTLPSGNPVVSGTVIEASWANSTLNDMSDALTDSLSRSGKGGMTAPFRLIDGTVSAPAFAFANETGSGAYRAAAGDWYLTVLGQNIARLRASGVNVIGALDYSGTLTGGTGIINIGSGQLYKDAAGKLGLGTTAPAHLIDANGGSIQSRPILNTTGLSDWAFIGSVRDAANTGVALGLYVENQGSNHYAMLLGTQRGSSITEKARLSSLGSFGVNTNNPDAIGARIVGAANSTTDAGLATVGIGAEPAKVRFYHQGYDTFDIRGGGGISFWQSGTTQLFSIGTTGVVSQVAITAPSFSGNASTASNISNTGTVTLATATENNAITVTAPAYTTNQPVKLLNFNWYSDAWSLGNIRSGGTTSDGFGVYLNGTQKFKFTDGVFYINNNLALHAGNYNSYAPTLTGGGASGTWGINITGNANNITQYSINQNLATTSSPTFSVVAASIRVDSPYFRSSTSTAGAYTSLLGIQPADGSFQLITANGTGSGTGSEVAFIGTIYSGADVNAGISFNRGGSATDGSIGFKIGGSVVRTRWFADGSRAEVIVPSGSTLYPAQSSRAWVRFTGTGTVTVLAAQNVSSVADLGVGVYGVSFSTNMPDTNYAVVGGAGSITNQARYFSWDSPAVTSCRVGNGGVFNAYNAVDYEYCGVAVFR